MDLPHLEKLVQEFISDLQDLIEIERRRAWAEVDSARESVIRGVPTVQAIARAIPGGPGPEDLDPTQGWEYTDALQAAWKLAGAITVQRDLSEALRPEKIEVSTTGLHTWVQEASASLWQGRHYRQAVHAAAMVLDEHLQAKLGRVDIYGTDLARQAFSTQPPKTGQPRLRFGWLAPESPTYRSAHDGARDLATACAQLIRNTAAHRTNQLSESAALEQLATLSYLARLIESADVTHAGPETMA